MKKALKFIGILVAVCISFCLVILVWDKVERLVVDRKKIFYKEPVQYPIRQSNVTLYTNGKELYDQLFSDIEKAKHYIHISFFSIADDQISHRFENLLKQKSKEGVEVYYSLDRLGGILLKEKDKQSLLKEGVHFTYYNKPSFPYLLSSLDRRNHRRILVIDGNIGYTGGFNIGKKYLGEKKKLGHWRDYHLRFQGGGVQDLEQQFEADWTKNSPETGTVWENDVSTDQGEASLRFKAYSGEDVAYDYANFFHQAQKSITIITPYFIPNDKIVWNALSDARKRGVHIKVLWSPKSDALLVKQAAYSYIRKALSEGMYIYGYEKGVMHGKVLVIDEKMAMVGTPNLDSRSLHLNNELSCYIYDSAFVKSVLLKKINEDFQNAERINASYVNDLPLQERLKEYLAKLVEYHL